MDKPTLESLAAKVAELERKVAVLSEPTKDWRSVVGLTDDSEIMADIIAEGRAYRESLRAEAEAEADAEDARLSGEQK